MNGPDDELSSPANPGFGTLLAHAGEDPRLWLGAVTPPLYQNSTFAAPDCEHFVRRSSAPGAYDYTRCANPTTDILESKLAALERTEAARCFGSGMAAVSAAVLHCLGAGDHVVAVDTVYGPTREFLTGYLRRFQIEVTLVPGDDPQQFVDAIRPRTRLIYLESPSSLVMRLQDLAAVAAVAREREITTVLDNSWATPYFQNPIDHGIDLVLHSATKYLGGHSDLLAGVVAGGRRHMDRLRQQEGALLGAVLDPFASWLMLRGLRTLHVRMERHQENALAIAQWLEQHPEIEKVHYPGLASYPQAELARRQLRGFSGLLSVTLSESSRNRAFQVVDRLRLFGIAVSWGGFESLAIPILVPPDHGSEEPRWGIRFHIGLETVGDLLADLEQALR